MELREIISQGYPVPLDSYPIFSEDYRAYLNQKIIEHFYFREIGLETPEKFAFFLHRKMNEIMPYYNKMYEAELIQFDPLATDYFEHRREDAKHLAQENYVNSTSISQATTGDAYSENVDSKTHMDGTGSSNTTTTGDTTGKETTKGTSSANGSSTDTETIIKTGDKTRDRTEKDTTTSTTTSSSSADTDVTTSSTSSQTSDGTTKQDTKASKGQVFSDLPQAKVTITGGSGTGGAGIGIDGYATTYTGDNETSTQNGTNKETTDTDTSGDSTTHGTSTGESTTNGTLDVTEKITENWSENDKTTREGTTTNEGSTTGSTDTTGHSSSTSNTTTKSTEDTTANQKQDSIRTVDDNRRQDSGSVNVGETAEKSTLLFTELGRRGQAPADLIQRYRDTLINVDMLVIDELEPLFMQIY